MPLDDAEAAQLLSRIERLATLLGELEYATINSVERATIRERMRHELDAARESIRRFKTADPR